MSVARADAESSEAAGFAQLEAAAGGDPEAAELLAEHDRLRYETQSRPARRLHRRGQLKPDLAAREPPT